MEGADRQDEEEAGGAVEEEGFQNAKETRSVVSKTSTTQEAAGDSELGAATNVVPQPPTEEGGQEVPVAIGHGDSCNAEPLGLQPVVLTPTTMEQVGAKVLNSVAARSLAVGRPGEGANLCNVQFQGKIHQQKPMSKLWLTNGSTIGPRRN